MIEDRRSFGVLVPDAQAIGMIGVIRSLGRAGYLVHACAHDREALGLRSNFCNKAHQAPAYDSSDFLPWLRGLVQSESIRAIVPSEGFLLAVRPEFARYASLMPIPHDEALVYDCLSKSAVIERLLPHADSCEHLPPTLLWREGQPLPTAPQLASLGVPLFVKGDGADDRLDGANIVRCERSAEAAAASVRQLAHRYRRVLIQGFVPGQGTGAYVLIDRGEIVQEFMNRCIHEVPHTGGFCSLRDSWHHKAMMDDARRKIRRLNWQGVAMLEYRWDAVNDRFWFIELNARFWAALHVALFAGVDFPLLLLERFRGQPVQGQKQWPTGVTVRYAIPYDLGYVRSRWADKSLPLSSRLGSWIGWSLRFLDPRLHADLLFPRDQRLYFSQWKQFLRQLLR
jgi:hypothetical protein